MDYKKTLTVTEMDMQPRFDTSGDERWPELSVAFLEHGAIMLYMYSVSKVHTKIWILLYIHTWRKGKNISFRFFSFFEDQREIRDYFPCISCWRDRKCLQWTFWPPCAGSAGLWCYTKDTSLLGDTTNMDKTHMNRLDGFWSFWGQTKTGGQLIPSGLLFGCSDRNSTSPAEGLLLGEKRQLLDLGRRSAHKGQCPCSW